ncbi:MAG: FIMAH domain-containing protein [Candidatus Methylomirabilales bacterium]
MGPKPTPKDFVATEFLNYLITLVHDSRQQGWITRDGAKTSLLAKLTSAKRKLEAGQTKPAKNMLKAFLNEVEATSCQEFECPGNKPLTSEAYALLFFNGQFLWERL